MRRFCSVILAFAMTVSMFTLSLSAQAIPSDVALPALYDTLGTAAKASVDSLKESLGIKTYAPDEEVEISVVLSDSPMLDYSGWLSGVSLINFKDSNIGKSVKDMLRIAHESAKNKIKTVADVSFKDCYDFYLLENSFTLKTEYANLAAIKKVDGVKYAYVSGEYDAPVAAPIDAEMFSSSGMINADSVNETGYTGKGVLVGVLDSGLDITHEAFANAPAKATLSKINLFLWNISRQLNAHGMPLYKSPKVVFAYDYADNDLDVLNPLNDHGMHVTGIIAGKTVNSDGEVTFSGIAPEAEIAFFKVFSDNGGGATDAVIKSALEDAVVLGVDVLNMSLGSASGFTVDADAAMAEIYSKVEAAGICLCISAGNEYNMGFDEDGNDKIYDPYIWTPAYNVVGSPSTYSAALSVASIENSTMFSENVFYVNGQSYSYTDNAEKPEEKLSALDTDGQGKEYDIVFVPGFGAEADYAGLDVTGKIVFVSRGSLTFVEKKNIAVAMGAAAIVIYNNQAGIISMSITDGYQIPAVSITQAQMQAIKASGATTLLVKVGGALVSNPNSYKMSEFTSWGPTDTLVIKPEVTAPGGQIYSTLYDNSYGVMSGTSMAAPHVAGACAVALQYIEELDYAASMTKYEKAQLVNALIMSTSVPVINGVSDSNDVECEYSPRIQGAGLVDLDALVNTAAYLTVNGGRPKLEAGSSLDGAFTFGFEVNNLTDAPVSYTLEANAFIDNFYVDGANTGAYISVASPSSIILEAESDYDIAYSVDGVSATEITVPADGSVTVSGSLTLSDDTAGYLLSSIYTNGFFVDAFIYLRSVDGSVELSLPFVGFCGDWAGLDLFDGTLMEQDYYYYGGFMMLLFTYNDTLMYLDLEPRTDSGIVFMNIDTVRNYYGVDVDSWLSSDVGLLRNAKDITYTIFTPDGEAVYSYEYGVENNTAPKSYYYLQDDGGFRVSLTDVMDYQSDDWSLEDLEDGLYFYQISAVPEGGTEAQTMLFPMYIDTVMPEILGSSLETVDGRSIYTVTVNDDTSLLLDIAPVNAAKDDYAVLPDGVEFDAEYDIIGSTENEDGSITLQIDVTDLLALAAEYAAMGYDIAPDDLLFLLYDYAYNTVSSLVSENAVTTKPDKEALAEIIAYAESLDDFDYSALTWVKLLRAVNIGKAVYADENATPEQVTEAIAKIQAAIDGLKPRIWWFF